MYLCMYVRMLFDMCMNVCLKVKSEFGPQLKVRCQFEGQTPRGAHLQYFLTGVLARQESIEVNRQ